MKGSDVSWDVPVVNRRTRQKHLGFGGGTLWMTGLSGSGKSTLSKGLEARLVQARRPAYRLDGDNVRHGLCADLGFGPEARTENLRRVSQVAALMADAGLIVIAATISPLREHREAARRLHAEAELPFAEVYVDAPLEVCEARDPKGLYARARSGELSDFTGVSAPFEAPQSPELHLPTARLEAEDAIDALFELALDLASLSGRSKG